MIKAGVFVLAILWFLGILWTLFWLFPETTLDVFIGALFIVVIFIGFLGFIMTLIVWRIIKRLEKLEKT